MMLNDGLLIENQELKSEQSSLGNRLAKLELLILSN